MVLPRRFIYAVKKYISGIMPTDASQDISLTTLNAKYILRPNPAVLVSDIDFLVDLPGGIESGSYCTRNC